MTNTIQELFKRYICMQKKAIKKEKSKKKKPIKK